jgi:hypothetical protein
MELRGGKGAVGSEGGGRLAGEPSPAKPNKAALRPPLAAGRV